MPFYEYECPACKYYAEVLQKISDKPLSKCPSCGKKGFRRLMSAPVFRLKGSGWYETDFKSDKDNQRNLLGADREEAKPEAKPAAEAAAPVADKAKTEAAPAKTDQAAGAATGPAAAPPRRRRARVAAAKRKTRSAAGRKKPGARRR